MKLKYGMKSTYLHDLDKDRMEWIVGQTNRSRGQTLFLFQLVHGDFEQLKKLEYNIKNCFGPTPGDFDTAKEILSWSPKKCWFKFGS